jgi:hypothetical protein
MTAKRGTIYFAELDGRIKIGFSNNVDKRIAALRIIHSSDMELIETMDGTFHLERAIHRYLAAHSAGREWFVACPDVYRTIAGLLQEGPAYIGYLAENAAPKKAAEPYDYGQKIASGIMRMVGLDKFERAVDEPDCLSLVMDVGREISPTIERCKSASSDFERELIVAEFLGKCATHALRNLAGSRTRGET